jgi:predicted trehalose synthase
VLRTEEDFVILDFEGEPSHRSWNAAQALALKDVAGMMRSFSYAAYAPWSPTPCTRLTTTRRSSHGRMRGSTGRATRFSRVINRLRRNADAAGR